MGYIYLLTNKINKKQYVGQSLCNDINDRWNRYKKLEKNSIGRCLYSAFIKYGIDKFKFQIICICFDEDCDKYEMDYIKKYNTIVPNGYNLREGGNNSKHHPDTIALIKASLKGRRLTPITDEIRKKLSESLMGSKNPNFGKNISDEQKKKISDTKKERGIIRREQITEKEKIKKPPKIIIEKIKKPPKIVIEKIKKPPKIVIEKIKKPPNKSKEPQRIVIKEILPHKINCRSLDNLKIRSEMNKKRIGKYDLNNTLIEEYNSLTEASIKTKICIRTISKVCNGIKYCKTAGGFLWKFI